MFKAMTWVATIHPRINEDSNNTITSNISSARVNLRGKEQQVMHSMVAEISKNLHFVDQKSSCHRWYDCIDVYRLFSNKKNVTTKVSWMACFCSEENPSFFILRSPIILLQTRSKRDKIRSYEETQKHTAYERRSNFNRDTSIELHEWGSVESPLQEEWTNKISSNACLSLGEQLF